MKKLTLLTLTLLLTALVQLTAPPVQAAFSIPDANLAAAIRETLGLPPGASLTEQTMLDLTQLHAPNRGISDLTGLEHAINLKKVDLGAEYISGEYVNSNAISDVSGLARLTNLEWLSLRSTGVSDVSGLARLTNLETLSLYHTDVSDISALAHLTNLTTLNLWNTDVSDISGLAHLTNLTTLNLYAPGISDVSGLAHLTNLERLDLYAPGVSDVSGLAYLTNLTTLSLEVPGVSDVSALAHLTNLVWLHLSTPDVSVVSALASLTNLEMLFLWGPDVSDISGLARLTDLVWLYLQAPDVSDVSALVNLTNLEGLFLGGTGVSDVSGLAHLTNLTTLDLYDTGVSDVSGLAHLTNLEWLGLRGTLVSDVSPLLELSLPGTTASRIGLSIKGCPLSYASIHTHIPALQARGIEVAFDNVAYPALLKNSGDRQEGAVATALPNPFVVEAMDEHGKPIVGIPVQFDILEGGGTLSAKTVKTGAHGKARVTLTLGSSQGVNKVRASSEGIQSWVLFTAVATEEAP